MTQIEIGSDAVRHFQFTTDHEDADKLREKEDGEEKFPLHKVPIPMVIEAGIGFQRCGGGCRIIRKSS